MENAINVKNLNKRYGDFQLKDISFSLPKGAIMGFIGENGAGKTTTLKAILDLIHIDSGEIEVMGTDYRNLSKPQKSEIGVVMDGSFFHNTLTAKEIGSILKSIFPNWDGEQYIQTLEKFKLPSAKPIKEFSKGMLMKLSIATAICHSPKLLILDEATSGLDPIMRDEILEFFLDFISDEEHSILFSSHITSDLDKVADYITFIHEGKLIFSLPKDQLVDNFRIMHCTKDDFEKIPKDVLVGYRGNAFGYDFLTNDAAACRSLAPSALEDTPTVEDIMLYHVKGELK